MIDIGLPSDWRVKVSQNSPIVVKSPFDAA